MLVLCICCAIKALALHDIANDTFRGFQIDEAISKRAKDTLTQARITEFSALITVALSKSQDAIVVRRQIMPLIASLGKFGIEMSAFPQVLADRVAEAKKFKRSTPR